MLRLVEGKAEKRLAQRALEANFKEELSRIGGRNVGFPGGNVNATLYGNEAGGIYAAFLPPGDTTIRRYWNAFGIFRPDQNAQTIAVELTVSGRLGGQTSSYGWRNSNDTGENSQAARREREPAPSTISFIMATSWMHFTPIG